VAESVFNEMQWDPHVLIEPSAAAEVLDPLVDSLFTPRMQRSIEYINVGHIEQRDPPAGPAVVGFFRGVIPGTLQTDVHKPAEIVGAQLTRETGEVAVDLHRADYLEPPQGPCSTTHCGRLLYHEGQLEAQQIDGTVVEPDDPRAAVAAMWWALTSLDIAGPGYNATWVMNDRHLAVAMFEAGHQLTLPDAAAISRVLRFPYSAT